MNKILVVNAGSSTIKWKIFESSNLEVHAEGVCDRIFVDGILETKFQGQKYTRQVKLNSHEEAAYELVKELETYKIINNPQEIAYIGNRVVQGGKYYKSAIMINEDDLKRISELSVLAPLHNPGAVEAIKAFTKIMPHAKISATFDTSFHTTIPPVNYTYPINFELGEKLNIKKYGFHGTSHRYITQKLSQIINKDKVTFINIHIGNGASLCAVKDSESYDTSMGLTPLAGVMMGTRSGDIDPSIIKYIMKQTNMNINQVDHMLNKESGLKGVSGLSQDMRDITKGINENNERAKFALDLYTSKIADYIAMYYNKLGAKVDALVLTAGIGENSIIFRQELIKKLHFAKFKINPEKNISNFDDYILLTTDDSDIPIYIIRTNEELMIAKDALEVCK